MGMLTDELTRRLALIQELDRIRDSYSDDEDPSSMFTAMTDLLTAALDARACGIILLSENSDDLACVAVTGLDPQQAIEMGRKALTFDGWAELNTTAPTNTLACPILLDRQPLGAIILIRPERAFDDQERALLNIAEMQIDSAVIQARTIWKFRQRNRELEAIHAVDQLRDYTPEEPDLVSGFTGILLEYFQTELCMILLSHSETGDLVLRGIVDKKALVPEDIEKIRSLTDTLQQVEQSQVQTHTGTLHLLAGPLLTAQQRLGSIILGRSTPFKSYDQRLLEAIIAQMDSAVIYSRVHQQLRQRNRELEVIYRIDRIRDQETDLERMLQLVLRELCAAVSGEAGYIMLYTTRDEAPLEMLASTVEGLIETLSANQFVQQFSRQTLASARLLYDNQVTDDRIRSIVAVPLILNQRIIGVFGAINSANPRGFSREDRRLLNAITSQVDTAIFERLEQRRMRSLLSRSVDPNVLQYLLQHADAAHILAGKRVTLTALFADLRGSTQWAERTEPEDLVSVLNQFLSRMTLTIFKHGGTLDKFVGDEVIGLFGSPLYMVDHAQRAAAAALEMQAAHHTLAAELAQKGYELPPMGIGVSSGEAIIGEIGSPNRTEFTAIGRVMNLSSRLCAAAGPGEIYISQETYNLIQSCSQTHPIAPLQLKGISHLVPVYQLLALKDE